MLFEICAADLLGISSSSHKIKHAPATVYKCRVDKRHSESEYCVFQAIQKEKK